ncbi:putative cytokinetic ring protein SteA [Solicola gregarius]|uniref:Cytokinetic ring protein SteA n=1 Tax=Solicola gregarius TaxID=2908642 RepID=A0AA46THY5_9ACTN|nr:putative cytokinetic ring protein SteA [Solicola gregarius]UYM05194.1 putative cytokinetic ring protein SteA [Solicola gregarius]
MKLSLRRNRTDALPGVTGPVRLDRRTKNLTKRLRPGDIAVIDHADLDKVSAEALIDAKVSAVVNVAQSCTGSYPNLGPGIIADAGVPLVDNVGDEVFTALSEGDTARVDEGIVYRDSEPVGKGIVLDRARVDELMESAKEGLSTQLEAFTANTMEFLKRERELLLDGVGVPEVRTSFARRHALVVVRGYDYRQDLAILKSYIREYHPVLVGVDGGADALVEAGYTPDMIVGDMDSVSDETLKCGAELVVHAYRDGRAPGFARLEKLGLEGTPFPATGTSEDVAMLLADAKSAELIVAVGTHATLVEFLDKGRSGMASTFLTRLRLGPKLIDAKGVSRLHHTRIRMWQLLLLLAAGLLAIAVSIAATPAGQEWLDVLQARWDDFTYWIQETL